MSSYESNGRYSQPDARSFDVDQNSPQPSSPDGKGIRDDKQTGFGDHKKEIKITEQQFKSKEYDMKHLKIGRAIVINNKNFRKMRRNSEFKTRKYTDNDRDAIVKVLEKLGFEGVNYENVKTKKIEQKMVFDDVQKEDLIRLFNDAGDDRINNYTDMDCFICVILSYGEPGVIYCPGNQNKQQDDAVEFKKLMEPLKGNRCRTLVMKPKLFFIQGCPYEEKDMADHGEQKEMPSEIKKVPVEADFLTQSCHLPAYYGWMDGKTSWYIRALCEAIEDFCIEKITTKQERSLHFLTVLTRVNRLVAKFMNDVGFRPDRTLQIPLVTSLLTKHMYFYPKNKNN